jgi:hypothetical protein
MTPKGAEALAAARLVHRNSIYEHFARHLGDDDFAALHDVLVNVHDHVRPLRPGRISGPSSGPLPAK